MHFPRPIDSWYSPHRANYTYTAEYIRGEFFKARIQELVQPLLDVFSEMIAALPPMMADLSRIFIDPWK